MTITAKRKINRNSLDKQMHINYDKNNENININNNNNNFSDKFFFEFEKTPEERSFIKKDENNNSNFI